MAVLLPTQTLAARSLPSTLIVIWGHSNCREGFVPLTQTPPSNTFLYFPLIGVLPMPQPPSMGGLSTEIAHASAGSSRNYYLMSVCQPSTSFQPLQPQTGNPDFGAAYGLRSLILQTIGNAVGQLQIKSVFHIYLEPTADAVYATMNIGNLNQLANAYADLSQAARHSSKIAGATLVAEAVILMDGSYATNNPLLQYQATLLTQQQMFAGSSGVKTISAVGATFPDGTHYATGFIPVLAARIHDFIRSGE